MRKTRIMSLVVSLAALVMLAGTPGTSKAADETFTKCGERDNPDDGKKEHRWQAEGVCITGGDYHTLYWLDGCTEHNNHQSSSCGGS